MKLGEITVKELLDQLSIIPGEVGLILLNDVLKDGDKLELYPVVGGG